VPVPVAITNLGASANPDISSNTPANSFANSSWTPGTTGLLGVFVVSEDIGLAAPHNPGVSGNSVTWVQVGSVAVMHETPAGIGMCLFVADAKLAVAGVTTINYGAFNQNWCVASFFHAANADLSFGPAGAIVQRPAFFGVAPMIEMFATFPVTANSGEIACFYHGNGETVLTPRSGWSVLDDFVPNAQHAVSTHKPDSGFDLLASALWTTETLWGGMIVEVRPEPIVESFQSPGMY
jgi:hypothetical protein